MFNINGIKKVAQNRLVLYVNKQIRIVRIRKYQKKTYSRTRQTFLTFVHWHHCNSLIEVCYPVFATNVLLSISDIVSTFVTPHTQIPKLLATFIGNFIASEFDFIFSEVNLDVDTKLKLEFFVANIS